MYIRSHTTLFLRRPTQMRLFTAESLPLSLVIDVKRGPASDRFGRLRMARRPIEAMSTKVRQSSAPRWFAAMDHNHDDRVSIREYLGARARFQMLDRNPDGVLTLDEIADQTSK